MIAMSLEKPPFLKDPWKVHLPKAFACMTIFFHTMLHSLRLPVWQIFTVKTCHFTSPGSDPPHSHSISLIRKNFYLDSFFPRIATLWNRLLRGCLPDHYNLNFFKSRINHYVFYIYSGLASFSYIHAITSFSNLKWLLDFVLVEHWIRKSLSLTNTVIFPLNGQFQAAAAAGLSPFLSTCPMNQILAG